MLMPGSASERAGSDRRPAFHSARAAIFLAGAGIVAAGCAVYANALNGSFVYLDLSAIADNPTIRHLWPIWGALRPPPDGSLTVGGRPLLNLSLAGNYAISGLQPWSYHAVNILIHLSAGLALFGIVRRTLARRAVPGDAGVGAAFLAALAWTVHPLQTESVTYIVQRAESLMGLCYLLTLYGFIRSAEPEAPGRRGWAVLSFLACLLGMGAKEVMVSVPVIVLLYDRTFVCSSFRAAFERRRIYYLALAATWLPLAWFVHSTGGNRGGTSGFGLPISWWSYLLTQFPAVVHYLRLSLWPHPLVFYYEVRWVPFGAAAPDAAVVVLLAAATVVGLWRRSAWGFLGAWFFAILAPTSLVPGMSQTLAEHRMYLPLAAVCAGLAAPVWSLARTAGPGRLAYALALLAWSAGLGALTIRRNGIYRSELALWSDTVAKVAVNPNSQNNLGIALVAAGRPAEAMEHFERALALNPDYAEAHDNLALALAGAGRYAEAIGHYQRALQLKPDYPDACANLGVALATSGRLPEAIAQFERALQLNPNFVQARNNLAVALASTGRTQAAIAEYERVLQQGGETAEVHYNLGNALAQADRWPEAASHYQRALALAPNNLDARANLGVAFAKEGRYAEAADQDQRALAINPSDPDTHYNLGLALQALGRSEEAASEFARAERLRAAAQGGTP
jgi:tetratricopeptide (TPR) repeat protein